MPAQLKREASPQFVAQLDQLEERADKCEFGLKIYGYPIHLAVWAVLTEHIIIIENAIKQFGYGSARHRGTMINLGRSGAIWLPWVRKHCRPVDEQGPRWNRKLAKAALEIQNVAHNYSLFVSCFTMWHKHQLAAELIGQQHVRFRSLVENNQRRIRAYQQGVRVPNWPATIDEPRGEGFVKDPEVMAPISGLVGKCKALGFLGFTYPASRELLTKLCDIYRRRLESASRWPADLRLGGYTMGEFRAFYAALLAVCSVHEHLCFRWSQKCKRYPANSAVLAKKRTEWTDTLTDLGGLHRTLVEQVIVDLTFGRTRPLDIYIHPFIPAAPDHSLLFLIPGLPLNSRADENILRVFSYTHPNEYQEFSKKKEEEMRTDLEANNPHKFSIGGPVSLPGSLPDIDLLLEDASSSTLVVAEMKWTRKTVLAREHVERDEELLYGVEVQLKKVQEFLTRNPNHLKLIGAATRPLGEYANLSYMLIARDHLVWIPPQQNRYIVAYDALKTMLAEHQNLAEGVAELLRYDWLPLEGREFQVRFERAKANGVTAEAEVYHRANE
jgi:hypothetical protein